MGLAQSAPWFESADLLSNPAVIRLDAGEKPFSPVGNHISPAPAELLQLESAFPQRQIAFLQRQAVSSSGKPAGDCAESLAPAGIELALGQSGLLQRQGAFLQRQSASLQNRCVRSSGSPAEGCAESLAPARI